MTNEEWEARYGQWMDRVRAPNGDLQVRLERMNELVERRTSGEPGVLASVFGIALAFVGVPWFAIGTMRSQEERDGVVAEFLEEASAAERALPVPVETYRSRCEGLPEEVVLPWYRRFGR